MSIAVLKKLCGQVPWCELAVLEPTVELALEIAREGREGRRIGTLFTLGKAEAVLAASRPLILDPIAAHAPARTHITDPDLRGTIKELAQLDGAFVISEAGAVVAACRYLDASVEQIDLPLGLGSRHLAAASVSQKLGAIAIVVSESGVVRIFHRGEMAATLIPELWLLDRHHAQVGWRGVDDQPRSVESADGCCVTRLSRATPRIRARNGYASRRAGVRNL
jgi:hypothetical protein